MLCSPGRGSLGELEDELDDALDPTTDPSGGDDQEQEDNTDKPGSEDDE